MINYLVKIARAAGVTDPGITATSSENLKSMTIEKLFGNVADILALVAGILAFIYLVYSGILFLTAAGSPDSAKKGQQGITNAIIGIIVIVAAWAIIKAVTGTINSTLSGGRVQ